MKRNQIVASLQTNYQEIKEGKGKWFDKRVAYTIACSFVAKDQHYSDHEYHRMEGILKETLGVFNVLAQPARGLLLGMMLANGKSKDLNVHTLLTDYQRLRDAGFGLSVYSYFSAYLLQFAENAEKEFIIRRGRSIFQESKAHHTFLTGAEDGTVALALAQQESLESLSTQQIGDLVEEYYQLLNEQGFYKSNQLQFAAATAVLLTGKLSHELMEALSILVTELKRMGIKIKTEMYNSVVTLAFLATLKKVNYQALGEYIELIDEKTNLRFYKDFRHSLALNLLIQEEMSQLSNDNNLNISALTINMIMAQEASAAAAAIAISATAASSSS